MKAKDLAVGMECYYDRSNSWMEHRYPGNRAVIVDPIPGNWRKGQDGTWVRSTIPGQEVLVDIYNYFDWERHADNPGGEGTTPHRMPVRTQALRGPWRQTYEYHMKRNADRKEAVNALQAMRLEHRARCERTAQLLRELGVNAQVESTRGGHMQVAILTASAALLAAAAQHLLDIGWISPTDTEGVAGND